jgi:rubrerythrin
MAVAPLELSCRSCGAKLVVEANRSTARCPYCDSPSVIDRPATTDRPDPVFAIGFAVDRAATRRLLRDYLRGKRWAPQALRRAAAHHVEGVYVPVHLYTAVASSRYSAEIGENYTTTEFDVRRKSTRRVTKTEFRSLQGSHRCYVDDRLVTASAGIPNVELEAVEPFDLGDLRRFAPAMISGWTAEEPSMTREASLELARSESRKTIMERLRAFMPGDAHRSLRASTTLTDEAMDLVLLPVWVCAVRWRRDREPIRLLVNGQTGRVAGSVPISWAKVAAILGAAIAVIGLSLVFGALL